MEGQSGLSELSVILWVSAVEGCPLSGDHQVSLMIAIPPWNWITLSDVLTNRHQAKVNLLFICVGDNRETTERNPISLRVKTGTILREDSSCSTDGLSWVPGWEMLLAIILLTPSLLHMQICCLHLHHHRTQVTMPGKDCLTPNYHITVLVDSSVKEPDIWMYSTSPPPK